MQKSIHSTIHFIKPQNSYICVYVISMPSTKIQKINMKSVYLAGKGVGDKKEKASKKKIGVNIHV